MIWLNFFVSSGSSKSGPARVSTWATICGWEDFYFTELPKISESLSRWIRNRCRYYFGIKTFIKTKGNWKSVPKVSKKIDSQRYNVCHGFGQTYLFMVVCFFRLNSIFTIAPAAKKNDAHYKSGKNECKKSSNSWFSNENKFTLLLQ